MGEGFVSWMARAVEKRKDKDERQKVKFFGSLFLELSLL
jgi:hypothetical protein